MAKDPAMLFYTADFLIGVAFMSMEERGQYITLLCFQQQRGHLTREEMEKAVGTLTPEVLEKFVQDEEGKYYNRRAEKEIIARREHIANKLKNFRSNIPSENSERTLRADIPSGHSARENENEIENIKRNKGVKGGEEEKKTRFTPPSVDEVAAYCTERRNGIDPQTFVDFYSSKGWKVGNQPMKDWRAAVRTWEQRHKEDKPKTKKAIPKYAAMSWDIVKEAVGDV